MDALAAVLGPMMILYHDRENHSKSHNWYGAHRVIWLLIIQELIVDRWVLIIQESWAYWYMIMWYCMRVSWNAGSPSHHGCFNTKSWSSVTGFGWDKLAKSFQINSNCAHMSLKILVAFPSHLQKNDWYELIWLFDDRRHEMLSLFFKWDADSVGRRPDGSNIPSVVSSNMAGNLQKRKFFFASKIIELNGEFPIAMFDYWRVRNWTVGQWATCTIFIHFPLVPSKENPQVFGVWMNLLRVFGSAVLAGHGQPFLSSTLAKNSNIGRVVDPSSASDRWTTQHRLFWFFLSLLKFLAEYLPILMGSFAKGSNALEFHDPIPTDIYKYPEFHEEE
jgi:hypothetical protein